MAHSNHTDTLTKFCPKWVFSYPTRRGGKNGKIGTRTDNRASRCLKDFAGTKVEMMEAARERTGDKENRVKGGVEAVDLTSNWENKRISMAERISHKTRNQDICV